jgi:DNA-binding CsgD family transcriptional regulator
MLDLEADTSFSVHRAAHCAPPAPPASTAPLLQAVLDGLSQAVAVLDPTAGLVYWNAAASARLMAAGWTIVDQRLRAPCAADRDSLLRALPNTCAHGRTQWLMLSLEGRPAHAALLPVEAQGQRGALLLLDREHLCGPLEMQRFASANGLTSSELRVLARLSQGLRPAQIAREHGVSRSTVQSQVAALRAKTNSSSVTNLLADLARLPAPWPKVRSASPIGWLPRPPGCASSR